MILNDGFENRRAFINKSREMNNLKKNGPSNFDNSFAKRRSEERRGLVQTTDSSMNVKPLEEVRGTRDNFVVQNSHVNNFNRPTNQNSRVIDALNNNRFKRPN